MINISASDDLIVDMNHLHVKRIYLYLVQLVSSRSGLDCGPIHTSIHVKNNYSPS
jgi:hypothetical protein